MSTKIEQNTIDLQALMRKVNNLPDAGGGSTEPISLQEKTVDPDRTQQVITADAGYDGLSRVTVEPIPNEYIVPEGTKTIDENGTYDIAEYANVIVEVSDEPPVLQEKTVTENGEVTPDEGYDGLSKVTVNVPTGGGGSANYVKFTAAPDSTISFIIENPLGGIAKTVSIKAISPTITSSRKIHNCCLDWNSKLGAVKAYYSSGNVTYVMTGIEGTPNNGNFRMTDGFITAYRFNSATTWDTTCEYEVEIYQ